MCNIKEDIMSKLSDSIMKYSDAQYDEATFLANEQVEKINLNYIFVSDNLIDIMAQRIAEEL